MHRVTIEMARPIHMTGIPKPSRPLHEAAVRRLLVLAQHRTIAGAVAADFLLAWWHADVFGSFDLSLVERLDEATQRDVAMVYELSTLDRGTPTELGLVSEIEEVAFVWYAGRAV